MAVEVTPGRQLVGTFTKVDARTIGCVPGHYITVPDQLADQLLAKGWTKR
jgi:hypothetical protein